MGIQTQLNALIDSVLAKSPTQTDRPDYKHQDGRLKKRVDPPIQAKLS